MLRTYSFSHHCTGVATERLVQDENNTRRINLLVQELLFLNLAHPVYKMWIKQEPNMLELWNKLHFEDKNGE